MTGQFRQTIKIVKPSKVTTDDHGRTVWAEAVETAELELVSTSMLKSMIDSSDERRRKKLHEAAEGKDGVLAHDSEKDRFEILSDEELQKALDSAADAPGARRSADVTLEPVSGDEDNEELSLVSTQMLRRILGNEEHEDSKEGDSGEAAVSPSFDPYNSA